MYLLKFNIGINLLRNPSQIQTFTPIIFLFFFSFYSTKQDIPDDTKSGFNSKKYQKSAIDDNMIEKLYLDIIQLLEDKKLYLNSDLTIEDISLKLNKTKHNISQTINKKTDNNFYYFINNFRVNEFKLAIIENRYPLYTIIDIALECGFNSSSVFYSFFKKVEKVTPKAYINSVINSKKI